MNGKWELNVVKWRPTKCLHSCGNLSYRWLSLFSLTLYKKMLSVLRRRGKVHHTKPRNVVTASKEPVAGPSKAPEAIGTNERDKAAGERKAKASISGHSKGGKNTATHGLSKANINVIRTTILILICFVICLFPVDFYFFYSTLMVFMHFCHLT